MTSPLLPCPQPLIADLRPWQREARQLILTRPLRDRLIEAAPGGGKTRLLCTVARDLIGRGECERVCVVVPTRGLCEQVAEAAATVGLQLDPDHSNRSAAPEPADHHGIVTTYAAIASLPELHRTFAGRKRTVAFFDEIHHAADERAWGDALATAFEPATLRVGLSGTPFRSDGYRIPFVRYEPDETGALVARPDFRYGYGDAVRDGICRRVEFIRHDALITRLDQSRISLGATGQPETAARLLRAALDPELQWLPTVLETADQRLTELRAEVPDAAGLVLCLDQAHAHQVARQLQLVTGAVPVVVTCDEPDAHRKLATFRHGRERWIVSVRMVAEGVDIPRLLVGVHATTTRQPLFLRQAVGRVVRTRRSEPSVLCATYFLPDHLDLLAEAARIEHEIPAVIGERDEPKPLEIDDGDECAPAAAFDVLGAEAEPTGAVLAGQHFNERELARGRDVADAAGLSLAPSQAAAILRAAGALDVGDVLSTQSESSPLPLFAERRQLRDLVNRRLRRLVYRRTEGEPDEEAFRHGWQMVLSRIGVSSIDQATVAQLRGTIAWLDEELGIGNAA